MIMESSLFTDLVDVRKYIYESELASLLFDCLLPREIISFATSRKCVHLASSLILLYNSTSILDTEAGMLQGKQGRQGGDVHDAVQRNLRRCTKMDLIRLESFTNEHSSIFPSRWRI